MHIHDLAQKEGTTATATITTQFSSHDGGALIKANPSIWEPMYHGR